MRSGGSPLLLIALASVSRADAKASFRAAAMSGSSSPSASEVTASALIELKWNLGIAAPSLEFEPVHRQRAAVRAVSNMRAILQISMAVYIGSPGGSRSIRKTPLLPDERG